MKKALPTVIILAFILSFVTSAHAFEISKTEQMDHHKMVHKLERGAINIVTSPMEIPKQIKVEYASESDKLGSKAASAFGGAMKGLVYFVGRLGSGLWDVVTFSMAVPENYEPLMKPEFIFEKK